VLRRSVSHGLKPNAPSLGAQDIEAYWERAKIADQLFTSLMTQAIHAGLENAPIGIKIDPRWGRRE
jgi:hypothetical protein